MKNKNGVTVADLAKLVKKEGWAKTEDEVFCFKFCVSKKRV